MPIGAVPSVCLAVTDQIGGTPRPASYSHHSFDRLFATQFARIVSEESRTGFCSARRYLLV